MSNINHRFSREELQEAFNRETDPEEGHQRYFVYLIRFSVYTIIGAENIHHASNKATKLWGPNWDRIGLIEPGNKAPVTFCPVKEFSKKIKKLLELKKKETNS